MTSTEIKTDKDRQDKIKLSNKARNEWQTWTERKEFVHKLGEVFIVLTISILFIPFFVGILFFGSLLLRIIFKFTVIGWRETVTVWRETVTVYGFIVTHSELINFILIFSLLISSAVIILFIFKMIRSRGNYENH